MLRAQERDDLSLIEGLGPFLEKKLNDIGVTTYKQVADWSDADIARVTKQIQYFEGRIEKDNWVGQAKILRDTPASELPKKPAESLGVDVNQGDDLKVVEGIGPKIEALLKSAGITTLAELAKADPADLEMMLTQADARYRMHEATTWPAQARLAANGDWDVLEDYQETLKGGRDDYGD
jgi:predicted flap endonuclease-1-like 5' DNA nuclease